MSQSLIADISGHTNRPEFFLGLTRAFLSCNIPLSKLDNFKLRSFLESILNGQEGTQNEFPDDLTASDFTYFKYSPITSVDVESSFSIYNNL
jgi:hypothetical protein